MQSIGPFDYKLTTKAITAYLPQVFDYMDNDKYRRVFRVDDQLCLVESKFERENKDTFIEVVYLNFKDIVNDLILQKIKWIFGFDLDLTSFYNLLELHPVMKEIKYKLFGLKLLRSASPFQAIIEAIIELQISKKASMTLRKRLAENYCDFVSHDGLKYYEFPRPQELMEAKHEDLRALGFTNNKVSAIKANNPKGACVNNLPFLNL